MNKIKFNSDNALLRLTIRDENSSSIMTFGDERHDNLLGFYLNDNERVVEIALYELHELIEGDMPVTYLNDEPFKVSFDAYTVDYSDTGSALIQSDFELYLTKDKLSFKFSDIPTDCEHDVGRVTCAFDDEFYPTYFIINDLSDEEYNQIIEMANNKRIPIVKKKLSLDEKIKEKIESISKEKKIKVLFSTKTGSRSWGYDVDDSDVDVRFVYKKDLDDILSLNEIDDSISVIDNEDDYVGYDIKKFLSLLLKQSVNTYEILYSNDLDNNDIVNTLRNFASDVIKPDKMVYIYKNIIKQNIRNLDNNSNKKTKKLIENFRMMATANYIDEKKEFPICNFETILSTDNNKELKPILEELIDKRKNGQEEINISGELLNIFNDYTSDIVDIDSNHLKSDAVSMASQIYKDVVLEDKNKSL